MKKNNLIKSVAVSLLITFTSSLSFSEDSITREFKLQDQVLKYSNRYQLKTLNMKLVDNYGNGYESLYGTRNLRAVLPGILYRGGANNSYNKNNKRDNQNPLPNEGLTNLCQEGFQQAVYLYTTNFNTAPQTTNCKQSQDNSPNQLAYLQMTAVSKPNEEKFIKLVYQAIKGEVKSPIYMHCWNGWHASGLVSTLALMQFCDLSNDQGLAYWLKNTDGNTSGYDTIKNQIKAFKHYSQYQITAEEKAQLCTLEQ